MKDTANISEEMKGRHGTSAVGVSWPAVLALAQANRAIAAASILSLEYFYIYIYIYINVSVPVFATWPKIRRPWARKGGLLVSPWP